MNFRVSLGLVAAGLLALGLSTSARAQSAQVPGKTYPAAQAPVQGRAGPPGRHHAPDQGHPAGLIGPVPQPPTDPPDGLPSGGFFAR